MDDIEKAINDDKEKSGLTGPTGPIENKPTEEEVKKAQALKELKEIEDAKAAALEALQKARADKRAVKKQPAKDPEAEVEKIIDENDPDSKAWVKKINESVNPVAEELEKEKAENRQLALDKFMSERPALAKNPEKLKELMLVYEKTHTATERNPEAVLRDLDKAYAFVYHQELLEAARQDKVNKARNDALFADIAVSRGSTAYTSPKETPVNLSSEENAILAKWGMSPQEWEKMKKEQDAKARQAV